MKLERVLWSKKPVRINMTVFTQLTLNRLPVLRDQCLSYKGPLSAAVHYGFIQDPDKEGKRSLSTEHVAGVKNSVAAVEQLFAE